MESFVIPAESKIIGKKKRKLQNEEYHESSSSVQVEESKTAHLQHKEKTAKKRASSLRSSSSSEWFSTSDEDDDNTHSDKSYSEEGLTDGTFSASECKYIDLKNINIFYNEKFDPLVELMQNVKTDILEIYPDIPDFENSVKQFSRFTKENLLFSCDFDKIKKSINDCVKLKMHLEHKIVKDIRSDFERAKEVDQKMDLTDWLNRKWLLGVKNFLSSTISVIKSTLFPEEDDSVTERIESIKKKRRKSKYKRRKYPERNTDKRQPYESVFLHHWTMFGGLFFLEQRGVMKNTLVIGDKIVSSTPDLAYPLTPMPLEGQGNLKNCSLLFVVEVKGIKPINNLSSECLEDQLDSYVLGQVGSELIAEAESSVLYPNSLGIVYMETTFIFVYLKMPKEHQETGFPLKSRGNIHYSRPFEMLKADDRAEVSEFLYWLGCIQNRNGRELY